MSLAGKVVVVTGGTGTLGAAVVEAAKAEGAVVVQLGRADLADEAAAQAAVNAAVGRHGGVDVVFNIAGRFEWRRVGEAEPELWRSLFEANVLTTLTVVRAALPHVKPGGAIISVAAAAARRAGAGMAAYTAAKSGVLRLTEALAEELASREVWVGSVSPTIIDTPQNRADMPDADTSAWIDPRTLAAVMLDLAAGVDRGPSGGDVVIGE